MEINFSNTDVVFIYGHFRKEARKLENIKNSPHCSISKSDINNDIKLYNSISDKLLDACPGLSKMDEFKL